MFGNVNYKLDNCGAEVEDRLHYMMIVTDLVTLLFGVE